MNITDEAAKRYPERVDDHAGRQEDRRDGFVEGADWARKEALLEAAQSIHDWASLVAGPDGAWFARIFEARLRALAEGKVAA